MEQFAEFQSISVFAEIGITLAGFGMLGSVLSSRRGSDHPALDAVRLINLVVASGVLALGALFPMVVVASKTSDTNTWIISSGLFAFCIIALLATGAIRVVKIRRKGVPVSMAVVYSMIIVESLALALLLANILMVNKEMMPVFYLTALLITAAGVFNLFFRIFKSLFQPLTEN